jgi:hypothetical protein
VRHRAGRGRQRPAAGDQLLIFFMLPVRHSRVPLKASLRSAGGAKASFQPSWFIL